MQSKKNNLMKPGILSRWLTVWVTILMGTLFLFQGCKKLKDIFDPDPGKPPRAIDIKLIADNFSSPIGLVAVPDNTHRLFVIDQVGKIWIINPGGTKLPTPFLDISSKLIPLNTNGDERGLLGLAFHPNYKENGRFFVYYNAPPRSGGPAPGVLWNNLSRISEFKVSTANPNEADMSSEKVILELDDPQGNHNGGTLAFGPTDGYLYISIGDGGAANDVAPGHVEDWYDVNAGGNGQDVEANLFGNILRIDINSGNPYTIPNDNPFVSKVGKGEIFAYGFRNPYRMSFDLGSTHDLYAGDAGQVLYEEINVVKKGGNYGWNVKEGTHCFNAADNKTSLASCPDTDEFGNPLIDPVIELNNWQNPVSGRATTIIGGHVYRGHLLPELYGQYIFGSFSQSFGTPNAELFVTKPSSSGGLWSFNEISLKSAPDNIGYFLKGFGQDLNGEVYLTVTSVVGPTGNTGKVFQLVATK